MRRLADGAAAAPASANVPPFIELLVFVAAECALFVGESQDRSATHYVVAPALVLAFLALGWPVIRKRLGSKGGAVADLLVLVALALVHLQMSVLIFLVIGSSFRNGVALPLRWWLAFVLLDFVVLVGAVAAIDQHAGDRSRNALIQTGSYVGVALALVLAAIRYANAARRAYDDLAVAHEELRSNVGHLEELATLRERERIALDIHDALGHELTTLAMQIEAAQSLVGVNDETAGTYLSRAHAMSLEALGAVRRAVHEIAADPLEREPLATALRRVCERFERASGIPLALDAGALPVLSRPAATHVVNIVREALTNVARHAAAQRISISAAQTASLLTIVVHDDGRGFDTRLNQSGQGLRGMRARARAIDATVHVSSRPGAGCSVQLCVPLVERKPSR